MIVDKLKAYGWQALALVLGALLLWQTLQRHAAQLDAANTRTATAETLRTIADLTAKAAQVVRERETQWAQAQEKSAHETKAQITAARVDADDARRAGDRLQQRVAALVASARAAPADSGAPGRGEGQRGNDAIDLLAGMQSRIDEVAGQLGEYSDQLRVAGLSCERFADALTVTAPERAAGP